MDFIDQINELSSQTTQLCYHCHKCTSGCPVVEDMVYGPDQVLRMVQLGEKDALLKSPDIWLCASCETCGTRCPNDIDIARVMDALRSIALQESVPAAEPDSVKFHKIFLTVVQLTGRMHELALFAAYKAWTMKIMADMDTGIPMVMKGKIPIVPEVIHGRNEVKRIFVETTPKGKPTPAGESQGQ